MPPVLRDPAAGLDCTETPFRPPKTISRTDLAVCNSCKLIFNGSNVGPKDLRPLEKGGLLLNESPLIQVQYNERTYGLSKTYLWQQGIHRNFKADVNYDLELNLYFRDIYFPDKLLAIVIPITIDNSRGKEYFSEINGGVRSFAMDTLIEDGEVLVYKGIDLQNRDDAKIQTAPQCQSLDSNLTWLVLPTTFIKSSDAAKIRSVPLPKTNTLPLPDHEITLARARQMCMLIPKIELKTVVDAKSIITAEKNKNTDVFLTRALQCQRIDPSKDVKGDAVYLNKNQGGSTLTEELDNAANLNKPIDGGSTGSFRAKVIEDYIGIIVGTILGIILIALLAYFIYTRVFKGYVSTVESADHLVSAATAAMPCKPPIII